MRFVSLAAIAGLAACSGLGVRGQQTPFGGSLEPSSRPGTPTSVARSGSRTGESKRVCRNKVENGWIAVDYLSDSEGCGALTKSVEAHPVALIVKYSGLQIGAALEVCAAERVPAGWTLDGWVDDADGRCPDDRPSGDPAKRTVRRIRRIN